MTVSDPPDYWVRSNARGNDSIVHYPDKGCVRDSPVPLCGDQVHSSAWRDVDVGSALAQESELCSVCQSIRDQSEDPRAHRGSAGRSPKDILADAGFDGGDGADV